MKPANPFLLGQIAIQEGLLTPPQLEECLALQRDSDPPRKLGAILLDRKIVTPEQLNSLMEIQRLKLDTIAADPERGGLFGQIALRLGFVTQLHLDECLREQHTLAEEGAPALLGQILLKKGYLSTDQFLQVLRRQRKETVKCGGCDTIFDSRNHPEGAKFICSRCGTLVQIPVRASDAPFGGTDTRRILKQATGETRGDSIGRYLILEQIGQGGMGIVYKVLHRDLNRPFALKVLKTDESTTTETVRRFQREARVVAKLKHPGIVAVHDAGEHAGLHYIAMEYLEGEPFSARLIAGKSRMRDDLVVLEKVVRAVAYAHGQGVIHRDLKPANVMVDRQDQPHVMDFGLAKLSAEGALLTREGAFLGTPFYMAPEQIQGDSMSVDAQSDVYSLGIMLYEILTHRLPYTGENSAEIFNKIVSVEPEPICKVNPKIHPDLQTICTKAIEKDRRARYATAEAMADDLRHYLEGEPILARPLGPMARLARRVRRNPAVALAAVTSALLAAAGLSLLAVSSRNARSFREHLDAGRAARAAGSLDAARSELEQALAVRPGAAEPSELLRSVLLAIGEREAAERARVGDEERRRKAEPRIEEARDAIARLGARVTAERLRGPEIAAAAAAVEQRLDEALALSPGHERALAWLARCRLLRGDLEGALRHLDEACRSGPFLDAAFERGLLLLHLWQRPRGLPRPEARGDRPVFADAAPDSPAAQGFRRRARVDLDAVRRHAESRWMFRLAEASMDLLDLRFEAAEEKLDAFVAELPGAPEALGLRAVCRVHLGRPDQALPDLDLALRYRPLDRFLRDWRAVARFMTGDADGALGDLSAEPADAGTVCLRGALRFERREFEASLADFQAALSAAPRFADALAGRAAAAGALGRLSEADADYGRALELEPEDPALHEARGLLRLRAGRRAEAAADLRRAVELSPARRERLAPALEASEKQ